MSIEKSLWDIDNMADLVLDGLGPIKSIVSDFFGGDFFSGDGTYPAVVISKPVDISSSEYTALGFPNYDANSSRNYRKFKVRIINKRNNPHAMLENPCDLSTATELCQQNSLIASHTTVATNQTLGFGIGALVKIKLDKLPNSTFNLQTAHYLELLQPNDTGAQILSKVACDSMSLMFEHGEAYEPPPPIVINSDLIEWADKYDAWSSNPHKNTNKSHLRRIEDAGKGFHYYVKAFFYLAYLKRGYVCYFSGRRASVRNKTDQASLYAATQVPNYDGPPASKTLGFHGAGLAIDINFDTGDSAIGNVRGNIGSWKVMNMTKAQNKQLWETSGIVDIAVNDVGLEWGGNFTGKLGFDPVHFQWLPAGWTKKKVHENANNPSKPPMSFDAGSDSDDPYGTSPQVGSVSEEGVEDDIATSAFHSTAEKQRDATSSTDEADWEELGESDTPLPESTSEPDSDYNSIGHGPAWDSRW